MEKANADQLEIIYYTDPLCCWSWGMEPQLRRIQYEYYGKINWRYCMGGLLPGWKNFHDEINSVSRPIQMGPVWMHAQQLTGMPMDSTLWMRNPPSSSYPACIAFKSVELQSGFASGKYLRLLREAVMLNGENISTEKTLFNIAETISGVDNFDFEIFKKHYKDESGMEAFRKDMEETRTREIKRFPSFIIKNSSHNGIILTGFRPYEILDEAIRHISPAIKKRKIKSAEDYESFWGDLTNKEFIEIEALVS